MILTISFSAFSGKGVAGVGSADGIEEAFGLVKTETAFCSGAISISSRVPAGTFGDWTGARSGNSAVICSGIDRMTTASVFSGVNGSRMTASSAKGAVETADFGSVLNISFSAAVPFVSGGTTLTVKGVFSVISGSLTGTSTVSSVGKVSVRTGGSVGFSAGVTTAGSTVANGSSSRMSGACGIMTTFACTV